MEISIKGIKNCKYDMLGNLFFDIEDKHYKITEKDALELAYCLFDSIGHDYKELEAVEEEIAILRG